MKPKTQNFSLPRRAIAGTVSTSLSLSCFIWGFWPDRELMITIGSHFGPTPRDLLALLGMLLTGVALVCCIWSWRTESRASAAVASAVAVPALIASTWMLMRI